MSQKYNGFTPTHNIKDVNIFTSGSFFVIQYYAL